MTAISETPYSTRRWCVLSWSLVGAYILFHEKKKKANLNWQPPRKLRPTPRLTECSILSDSDMGEAATWNVVRVVRVCWWVVKNLRWGKEFTVKIVRSKELTSRHRVVVPTSGKIIQRMKCFGSIQRTRKVRGDIFVFIQVGERINGKKGESLWRPASNWKKENGHSLRCFRSFKKKSNPLFKIEKVRCEDESIGDGQRKERQVPFFYLEAMYHCGIETRNRQLPPSSLPE